MGERDGLCVHRPGGAQRAGAGGKRRPGRDDVIHEQSPLRNRAGGLDPRSARQALMTPPPTLAAGATAAEAKPEWRVRESGERRCQLLGRVESAPGVTQRGRRHRNENSVEQQLRRGAFGDQVRSGAGGRQQAAELERDDEVAGDALMRRGGPGLGDARRRDRADRGQGLEGAGADRAEERGGAAGCRLAGQAERREQAGEKRLQRGKRQGDSDMLRRASARVAPGTSQVCGEKLAQGLGANLINGSVT